MATYDITQALPTKIEGGDVLNCPYSGARQALTLPPGVYKLECWGGQGCDVSKTSPYTTAKGGLGGYSVGTLTLARERQVYFYAGGKPPLPFATIKQSGQNPGGFNGGGYSGASSWSDGGSVGGGGGGGSDVRLGADSLHARVIVAGGGAGTYGYGGYTGVLSYVCTVDGYEGGGTTGNGYDLNMRGTQTSAGFGGSFGQGANSGSYLSQYHSAGGGGGWYGGGTLGYGTAPSDCRNHGSGSGYVFTHANQANYPAGCLLTGADWLADAQTIKGAASIPKPTGGTEWGHEGNGYVRVITLEVFRVNNLFTTGGAFSAQHLSAGVAQPLDCKFVSDGHVRA